MSDSDVSKTVTILVIPIVIHGMEHLSLCAEVSTTTMQDHNFYQVDVG